jgi:hypothetical protein
MAPVALCRSLIRASIRRCTQTTKDATRSKARLSTERPKNVTHVVGRLDSSGKFGIPVRNDPLDNLDSGQVHVLESQLKPMLIHLP